MATTSNVAATETEEAGRPVEDRIAAARAAVRRLRLVAAHPALDFVNTQTGPSHREPEDDALAGYPDLLAWAEYAGIVGAADVERLSAISEQRASSSDDVIQRARELRTSLYEVFESIADGRPPSAGALATIAAVEREALGRAVLAPGESTCDWSWRDLDDLARPLWLVVHAAVELLRTGPLDRLKECASCRFLFLDESKNKSRRWCSMSDCGTASKMRTYVARRAARRAEQRR